jgi:hypothetical protein
MQPVLDSKMVALLLVLDQRATEPMKLVPPEVGFSPKFGNGSRGSMLDHRETAMEIEGSSSLGVRLKLISQRLMGSFAIRKDAFYDRVLGLVKLAA